MTPRRRRLPGGARLATAAGVEAEVRGIGLSAVARERDEGRAPRGRRSRWGGGGRPSVPKSIGEARAALSARPSRPKQRTDHCAQPRPLDNPDRSPEPAGPNRPLAPTRAAPDPSPTDPHQPPMDTTDARPLALATRLQHDPRRDPRAPRPHLTRHAPPTQSQPTLRPPPACYAYPETVTRHRSVTLAHHHNAN